MLRLIVLLSMVRYLGSSRYEKLYRRQSSKFGSDYGGMQVVT